MRRFRERWTVRTSTIAFGFLLVAWLGSSAAQAQDFAWAVRLGGPGSEEGRAIAVDAAGNAYITGTFQGTVDFDPGPGTYELTSEGGKDIFVSKLDANGDLVWAKQLGGTDPNKLARGIAVDSAGNVYTTGSFQGTVDFDPGPGTYYLTSGTGGGDTFVSKLDANGGFAWAKQTNGYYKDWGNAIAIDGAGNVYTTGIFQYSVDFDPGPGTYYLTSDFLGVFVWKLDRDGNFVWAKRLDAGSQDDGSFTIAVDGGGNVYTTGYFRGTVDFDPGPGRYNLTSYTHPSDYFDAYVWKLDTDGDFRWAKQLTGPGEEEGRAIAVDSAGNVYTTGFFASTADFDPGPGTYYMHSWGDGPFISKLDPDGNFIWAKQLGGTSGADRGYGIAVDSAGNVYTTGYFNHTEDFDPGPGTNYLTSASSDHVDAYVSKLDPSGGFIWAKGMGGTADTEGLGIAFDRAGNVYTIGSFSGVADLNPGPGVYNVTSAGEKDVFVMKLAQPPALTFTDSATLTWSPLFGEAEYNIYRSDTPLPGTFGCLASHQTDPAVTDTAEPAAGGLYAYLVTSVNVAGQEGSMGFQEVNGNPTTERPNTNPCP